MSRCIRFDRVRLKSGQQLAQTSQRREGAAASLPPRTITAACSPPRSSLFTSSAALVLWSCDRSAMRDVRSEPSVGSDMCVVLLASPAVLPLLLALLSPPSVPLVCALFKPTRCTAMCGEADDDRK